MTTTLTKPITTGFTTKLCTNQKELDESMEIRMKVFVEEQGFTIEEELDEKDPGSDHFLLLHKSESESDNELKVVGTIRWYPPLNKLGRLAVLKDFRGGGAGAILVKCLEDHLKARAGKSELSNRGLDKCLSKFVVIWFICRWEKANSSILLLLTVVANSQKYAIGFYAKQGYKAEGEEFIEDGELHMRLVKILNLQT